MIDAIRDLAREGQSLWYDGLRRGLLRSGELSRLVEDGVRGLTTNPAIYETAIAETADYDDDIAALAARGLDAKAIYETLAVEDLRSAADLLRATWEATDGRDGLVSLEVSPFLARDTPGTIAEGRRLWRELDRPNVLIKVPGTPEGIPAVEGLAAAGVNVNVTLLFSRVAYRHAAEAWMSGLEARARRGEALSRAVSVASFFVSRIDSAVDRLLDDRAARARTSAERDAAKRLLGRAGIANATLAYADFQGLLAGERWLRLAARGAPPQRMLFASTSVKDPRYPSLMYVESLVGRETVDTVPPATLEAMRRGLVVRSTLDRGVDAARERLAALEALGISLESVAEEVLEEGVRKFTEPFRRLLAAIDDRRARLGAPGPGGSEEA